MPAGSDRPGVAGPPALPRTWRPLGPRIAGLAGGGSLVAVMTVLWVGLDQEVRDSVTWLQRGIVLGAFLLGFTCLYALIRSRVVADADGVTIVNGYRRHRYEWPELVAVHLGRGQPWATIDLSDGTTVSAMGIQGSDGGRATQAVRDLRALVNRSDAPGD